MALSAVAQRRIVSGCAALLAFIWFTRFIGAGHTLNIFSVGWMIEGDWFGHLFGWLFARSAPWGLPVALAPDLLYPTGSSAAFTDSIPLFAFLFKVLGTVLPDELQYFGLFMLLGYMGSAILGARIIGTFTSDPVTQVIGSVLFIVNPILVGRYGHPPFLWNFLIVGAVWLAVRPVTSLEAARRTARWSLVFAVLGGSINAYLAVMSFALTLTVMARLAFFVKLQPLKERLAYLAAGPLAVLLSMAFFGFFAGMNGPPMRLGAEGFGEFSADLLTFVNSCTWSRILPAIHMGPRQYEGAAYLGFGILCLVAVRLLAMFRPGKANWAHLKTLVPFVLVASAMFFYALSNLVTVAGERVADLSFIYVHFQKLTAMFRSSGRFVWPMNAALIIFGVSFLGLLAKRLWLLRAVVLLAAGLQVYDLKWNMGDISGSAKTFTPFQRPEWKLASQGYKHFFIHPVMVQWICPYNHDEVARVSWEAYTQHLTINSGHVGRVPISVEESCFKHLAPEELDPETIYLPQANFVGDLVNAGYLCRMLDGYPVCVSQARETPLLHRLSELP